MKKVKSYMNEYKSYVKVEKEKLEAMKKSGTYSSDYLADQEKKMKQSLSAKRQEYLKVINEIIDGKLSGVNKPDTSSSEYQAAISNIFTKIQLIGKSLNPKLLNEILEPAITKQDNSTIEAVRSYIQGLNDFPGGEPVKNKLLQSIPRVINQKELLESARQEINSTFDDNFGNNYKSAIALNYLEQIGVFEL